MEANQLPTMPNEITTLAPTERTARILTLANDALTGVEDCRQRIRRSTEEALECGRLLLEERAHVQDTLGHGAWGPYFEAHFANVVSERHARHWMKQAKTAIAELPSDSQPNELRNQVLTLGLFPPKQHTVTGTASRGASEATATIRTVAGPVVTLPKHSTHLGLINRFSAWATWLRQETKGRLDSAQAKQLLKDFEPIEQFIEQLRETIEEANRSS